MLSKLALSTLSFLGLGQKPVKPESLATTLNRYIPVHGIPAIVMGYLNRFEVIQMLTIPGIKSFSANSRYLLERGMFSGNSGINYFDLDTMRKAGSIGLDTYNRIIATYGNRIVVSERKQETDTDCSVTIYDLATKKEKNFKKLPGEYATAAYSPDGNIIALGSAEYVRLYDANTDEHLVWFNIYKPLLKIIFSIDGSLLLGICETDVYIWNVSGKYVISRITSESLKETKKSATKSYIFKSGTITDTYVIIIIEVYENGKFHPSENIIILDKKSGDYLREFALPERTHGKSLSPNGKYIADVKTNKQLIVRNIETGEPVRQIDTKENLLFYNFEKNGDYLFYGTATTASLVDVQSGIHQFDASHLELFEESDKAWGTCMLSPDLKYLVIGHWRTRDWYNEEIVIFQNPKITFDLEMKALLDAQKNKRKYIYEIATCEAS